MEIRAPEPDDAGDILAIVRAHGLPAAWTWPEGKHGLVADEGGVQAFCILSESIYGLVVEELWEVQSRAGFHGLICLADEIETIAQDIADKRGTPVGVGGNSRRANLQFIAAMKKRGYTEIAVVVERIFTPRPKCETGLACGVIPEPSPTS